MRAPQRLRLQFVLICLLLAALGLGSCQSSYKGRKYKKKCKPCPGFNEVPKTPSSPTAHFEDFAQAR